MLVDNSAETDSPQGHRGTENHEYVMTNRLNGKERSFLRIAFPAPSRSDNTLLFVPVSLCLCGEIRHDRRIPAALYPNSASGADFHS